MKLNEYQQKALETAIYPGKDEGSVVYPALGLAGEAGEVVEKVKKLLRDKGGVIDDEFRTAVKFEMGDVLWYLAVLADAVGFSLEEVARTNVMKLHSRQQRNVLSGDGDNR